MKPNMNVDTSVFFLDDNYHLIVLRNLFFITIKKLLCWKSHLTNDTLFNVHTSYV